MFKIKWVLLTATVGVLWWAATAPPGLFSPADAAEPAREPIEFIVRLPADATLEIDGFKTTETGVDRVFVTPPLTVEGRYSYTFRATSRGKEVTRQVSLSHRVDNTFDLRAEFLVPATTKTQAGQITGAGSGRLTGQVHGAGRPIVGATVTLYAAGEGNPTQLGEAKTNDDGDFRLDVGGDKLRGAADKVLYLVARGGTVKADGAKGPNDGVALLSVLGTKLPKSATVNELTTVASAFTFARFLNGEEISGNSLGLRIAAGNTPNLVDPVTGG